MNLCQSNMTGQELFVLPYFYGQQDIQGHEHNYINETAPCAFVSFKTWNTLPQIKVNSASLFTCSREMNSTDILF